MKPEALKKAREELDRFSAALTALETAPPNIWEHQGQKLVYPPSPKLTGAVRRASMDLTRALAEMRKP